MKTLAELEALPREYLMPSEVAPCFGIDPQDLRCRVWEDQKKKRNSFPFPVMIFGNRVKIPKQAFIKFMKGE